MAEEKLIAGELPEYLTTEICSELGRHAACFLCPGENDEPPSPYGSGTFVQYREHFGILTASHVVRELKRLPSWSLGFAWTKYAMPIRGSELGYAYTPEPPNEALGPDIGFVRINSADTLASLRSFVTFVDLAYHKPKVRAANKVPTTDPFWCQVGFPAEFVQSSRIPGILTTTIRCMCFLGGVDRPVRRGRFDYYDGEVFYEGQDFMPTSFKGMSGSSLWSIRIRRHPDDRDRLQMTDRLLSGVVYYELKKSDGVVSGVRSHGRSSIYRYAIDELITRY
jgi:hypothetical protein